MEVFLKYGEELQKVLNGLLFPQSAPQIEDISPDVEDLLATYFADPSVLAEHIELIAVSPYAGKLEKLLNSMVLFYIADRENLLLHEEDEVGFTFTVDSENSYEKVQKLKEIFFKTENIDAKAVLVRGMFYLEPSNGEIETLYLTTMRDENLNPETGKIMYFEYLQRKVDELSSNWELYEEILTLLGEAKERFPDNDLIYEIDGHLGVNFLFSGETDKAQRHLKEVYEWTIYRGLADIEPTYLSVNFLYFLARYAELLLDEGEIQEAQRVFKDAKHLAEKYEEQFLQEFPEAFYSYLEELKEVEEKLRGH